MHARHIKYGRSNLLSTKDMGGVKSLNKTPNRAPQSFYLHTQTIHGICKFYTVLCLFGHTLRNVLTAKDLRTGPPPHGPALWLGPRPHHKRVKPVLVARCDTFTEDQNPMAKYWVVGAMYSGNNDQAPKFIRRALGVVTEVDAEDKRVYVTWIADDLNRVVESRGCFQSIHGPFDADDPWVKEVFLL